MSRLFSPISAGAKLADSIRPGDHRVSLTFEQRVRTFLLHVPAQAAGMPVPVVINFHGAGSNAAQQKRYSGMDAAADRHGFIVVYPNGTGRFSRQRRLLTFNAGGCCRPATRNDVNDVGFTEAILCRLEDKGLVDARRVFAAGMSNGGMMAHRLAADSTRISAIASVGGQLNLATFAPARPISIMEFHSVDDRRALFYGGLGARVPGTRIRNKLPPVQAGIDQWAAHNGCPRTPVVGDTVIGRPGTPDAGQSLTKISYGPGRNGSEVILQRLTGCGHVWPGSTSQFPKLLGRATTLIDANEAMWEFFAAHPAR